MFYINYIFVINREKILRLRKMSLRRYVFFLVYLSWAWEAEVKRRRDGVDTNVVWWENAQGISNRKRVLLRIDFSVRSQSGIRHRATISRQTIRLSRKSTTHPPLTSIVFLFLCIVFLAYSFCQRARKYNASDRINRSLPCWVHCYQNGEIDFLCDLRIICKKCKIVKKDYRKLRIF